MAEAPECDAGEGRRGIPLLDGPWPLIAEWRLERDGSALVGERASLPVMGLDPLFSVVIPTYRRPRSVAGAVASVLAQTLDSFEVIVVDDGSPEGPLPWMEEVSDPRVRHLRTAHRGPSAARNAGAAIARGRYIAFLDDDDRVAPRWLETLARGFQEPEVEVVRCGQIVVGADGVVTGVAFPGPPSRSADDVGCFLAATYALPLDLFRGLGGFDERLSFGEHTELAIRIVSRWRRTALPVRTFPSLLVRRAPSGRVYGAAQGEMARFVLEHHAEFARRDRQLRGLYHRIAGVQAAKGEDFALARRHLVRAFLSRPWEVGDGARAVVGFIPPLARRVWEPASQGRAAPEVEDGASVEDGEETTPCPNVVWGSREGRVPDLVTVVLPVRNGAATIEDQLAALARQDFPGPWELVVVDNGSTDGTAQLVERWRGRVPDLRVVRATRTASPSYARNVGLRAARGDFLAFCDADDVASERWLSALVSAGRKADLVAGALDASTLNEPLQIEVRGYGAGVAVPTFALGYLGFASGGNFGVWRDVAAWLGGWREDYPSGEDVEFGWRLQLAGFSLAPASEAVVHYRLRSTLRSFTRQMVRYGCGQALLYRDYRAAGMPRRLGLAARQVAWLVTRFPLALFRREVQWRWARVAGLLAGRLWETVRIRTFGAR